MRFNYQYIDSLPKLAWLADYDQENRKIIVYHGSHVEVRKFFFIEGAWNGPFTKGDFAKTDCIFGSGGIMRNDQIEFVSSSSTTDFLYYKKQTTHVIVSNSLSFLLAFLEDTLDPQYLEYAEINNSIKEGINHYIANIPTVKSSIRRLIYRNLVICCNQVSEIEKKEPPHFRRFIEYRSYLEDCVENLFENARDLNRKHQMQILSTQSKGYDTTAINSIGSKFGIDKVFSCPESKEKDSFYLSQKLKKDNDDGSEICDILKLKCVHINRLSFESEFPDEYLYYAGLHENQDMNLREIHNHISNVALLLTGHPGEIWYTLESTRPHLMHMIDSDLKQMNLSLHGLSEVRLHAGYIQAAIPSIGAKRRQEILNITEDQEMNAWRLGGVYDRPIARRIGEDAGIPRSMFGQKKLGTIVDFPIPSNPYSSTLKTEYYQFLRKNHLLSAIKIRLFPLIHIINNYIYWKKPQRYFNSYKQHPILYYFGRIYIKLLRKDIKFKPLWSHLNGSLFCFCVNKTSSDYKQLLHNKPNSQE